jgi:membrane protein
MALMRAFNMALHQKEKRTYFKARWIALLLTFLLVFVLFSAIVVLIVGTFFINFLNSNGFTFGGLNMYLLEFFRYLSIFLIFFIGICVIYYIAPAISKKLKFFNAGAIFASIMSIIITNAFSYYLVNFNSYNKLYGSIGTLIGLMVWIYLIALILILGFEINISFRMALSMNQNEKTSQQSSAGDVYNKP